MANTLIGVLSYPWTLQTLCGPDQRTSNQQAVIKVRDDSQTSKTIIFSTFTNPGRHHFSRIEDIEIELALKKLHSTDSHDEATIDTASRLNTETTVNTDLLESLIANQVSARTKR